MQLDTVRLKSLIRTMSEVRHRRSRSDIGSVNCVNVRERSSAAEAGGVCELFLAETSFGTSMLVKALNLFI